MNVEMVFVKTNKLNSYISKGKDYERIISELRKVDIPLLSTSKAELLS